MNKAYNRCLFTQSQGELASVHPADGRILGNLPGSHANNIYLLGSDKLNEVQLYMSTRQPQPSLTLKSLFMWSDLAVKAAKSENKKSFFNVREGSSK